MLLPVIPLAFHAAISNEIAGVAFLQLDVITSSNAAGSTVLHRVALSFYSCAHFHTTIITQRRQHPAPNESPNEGMSEGSTE